MPAPETDVNAIPWGPVTLNIWLACRALVAAPSSFCRCTKQAMIQMPLTCTCTFGHSMGCSTLRPRAGHERAFNSFWMHAPRL